MFSMAQSAQVAQPALSNIVRRLISLDFGRRNPYSTIRRQIRSNQPKLLDGIAIIFDVIEMTRKVDI